MSEITDREMTELSFAVARELTVVRHEPWFADQGYNSGQRKLIGPDGAELFMREDRGANAGRIIVSASYPSTDMTPEHYSITVAASRGAKAIAREVSRRIMDAGYPAELADIRKHNEVKRMQYDARGALLDDLARLFGGRFERRETYNAMTRDFDKLYLPGRANGHVEAYGAPDAVSIDLRCVPAEVARKILAVCADELAKRPAS